MRIDECRVHFLTYRYTDEERWSWSGGVAHGQAVCLVQVATDSGVTGLGEINLGPQAPEVVTAAVAALAPVIVGEEARNIQRLWAKMYKGSIVWGRRGLALGVIGGIETALWDIAGKTAGRPVFDLLGGRLHPTLRAYASGGVRHEPGLLEQELQGYVEQGFSAVKIRIGFGSMADNLDLARRARESLGDDVDLMLDAGQGYVPRPWSVPEAIRAAKALEVYDPFWLEEPYLTDEPEGYAQVRTATSIPIAGGENGVSSWEFKELLERRSLDIVQPDVTVVGGILECRKVATLAAAHSVPVANHMWGSSVSLAANLHCLAATPNALIAEYPCITNPLRDALFIEPLRVEGGEITLPELPGLGVQLTDELLRRFPADAGVHTQLLSGFGERRDDNRREGTR
jgi:L-alanine-DL-glutamate epimerase-like enolase superfamily enzyme